MKEHAAEVRPMLTYQMVLQFLKEGNPRLLF